MGIRRKSLDEARSVRMAKTASTWHCSGFKIAWPFRLDFQVDAMIVDQ